MTNKEHNILVVDDDYNFLFLLIGIITNKLDKDYVLFTSSDGTDALIKAGKII